MSQKRNRAINWDEEEKQLFRSVFKEYAQIIENKSLDTNTNKIKVKAWEQFHKKFNELNSRPRELNQLKIQWKTMKVNARKTYSDIKKETNKTGGGPRPASPNEAIIEIKDLLNPAELLRDYNLYDSDGAVIRELEFSTTSDTCSIKSQDSKLIITNVNSNKENEQIANINMCLETIEDVDDQVAVQKFTQLEISQENAIEGTPLETNIPVHSIPEKVSEDVTIQATPMKDRGTTPAKRVVKRKINNIINSGMNSKKNHEDYVNGMLSHSKMLKDEEHMRRMEMADEEHANKMEIHKMAKEEHAIKMKIHGEKLKSVILEREMFELKKAREAL